MLSLFGVFHKSFIPPSLLCSTSDLQKVMDPAPIPQQASGKHQRSGLLRTHVSVQDLSALPGTHWDLTKGWAVVPPFQWGRRKISRNLILGKEGIRFSSSGCLPKVLARASPRQSYCVQWAPLSIKLQPSLF